MDAVLVVFAALLVTGLLVAVFTAIARWRGIRRVVASLVALGLVSHAIKAGFDVQRDPSSHNLWPFEAIIVAGGALVILGVAALVRSRPRQPG